MKQEKDKKKKETKSEKTEKQGLSKEFIRSAVGFGRNRKDNLNK